MKASVILAHPYKNSFNHAIYRQVIDTLSYNKIEIFSHDLYKEKFNPVLTVDELGKKPAKDRLVKKYSNELLQSDYIIFIHPNWWGQPPAILKGYIDRVIRPPHAYDFDDNCEGGLPIGKLSSKTGIVFNTSNTEENREETYFGDPLQNIWEKCIFGFCGIEKTYRKMYWIIADSTEQERKEWLNDIKNSIEGIIKESSKK